MKRTYLTRPNSYIMDVFLNGVGIDREEAAEVFGVSYQYFYNKLSRESIISVYDRAKELKNEHK